MYSDYVSVGFDPAGFWSLTPRLYLAEMDGANKRLEREAKDAAWHAWHVAAWHRAKKLPRLERLMKPTGKQPKRSSPNWQAQAGMWAAYAARKSKSPTGS